MVQTHDEDNSYVCAQANTDRVLTVRHPCAPFSQKGFQVDFITFDNYWYNKKVHKMQLNLIFKSSFYPKGKHKFWSVGVGQSVGVGKSRGGFID